ncbi:MAG TPA: VOC family protein [Anaeromyxobacteraceae bacterium]|nr:VOC family protein [Anaeromyxobacteraceae bacterium]
MALPPIGIRRLEALHYFVHDLERSRRFYTRMMDFAETAVSSPEHDAMLHQRSAVFEAGSVRVVVSEPLPTGTSDAGLFLRKHPDGVGSLMFEVEDAERAFRLLEERGATPTADVVTVEEDGATFKMFCITTPFGDTTFMFTERRNATRPYPMLVPRPAPAGGSNRFGFGHIDHVTSNFLTMKPALLWMEHVLGFEEFWEVQFHTSDVARERREAMHGHGSGLRSVVMRDPHSGVKFANNEPWRPDFQASQIQLFHEDLRGDGVQHAALTVKDIQACVRGLRERGVEFMPTPGAYYDMLPERLARIGVGAIEEDVERLRELGILVDGGARGAYMLQIFLKDSAGLYREPQAGPFFYEIIQRKGDEGFGAGNFRALFESIEREQVKERRG